MIWIENEVMGKGEFMMVSPKITTATGVSPLAYDANALEAAFVFGEAGIPTGFMDMTIGAGIAPATVAGNAVLANFHRSCETRR